MKQARQNQMDFLRLIFSILIFIFHIFYNSIMSLTEDIPAYAALKPNFVGCGSIVAVFFILGGIYLYKSVEHKPDTSFMDFAIGRVVRLWPLLLLATICQNALWGSWDSWESDILSLLFFRCNGLSTNYQGILWYISPFFWCSLLYFAILRYMRRAPANILISVLTYLSAVFLVNYSNATNNGRETVMYVFSLGTMRAVSQMGIGVLLVQITDELAARRARRKKSAFLDGAAMVVRTLVVLASGTFIVQHLILGKAVSNGFFVVVAYSALLACFLDERDIIAKLLNRPFFGWAGKFAYSIYVMQQTTYIVLRKTLWTNRALLENLPLCLFVSVCVGLVISVAAYYIVERPVNRLYAKLRTRN